MLITVEAKLWLHGGSLYYILSTFVYVRKFPQLKVKVKNLFKNVKIKHHEKGATNFHIQIKTSVYV